MRNRIDHRLLASLHEVLDKWITDNNCEDYWVPAFVPETLADRLVDACEVVFQTLSDIDAYHVKENTDFS